MSFVFTYSNLVGTLSGTSGDNAGVDVRGRAPGQTLRIVGATTLASVATGVNTGTAGTGTSPTSVAKPTASANWTAADLVGKWLLITGGAGYSAGAPILRPILSNTSTTLAVNTVSGMDNTTTFQIVTLATAADRISSSDLVALRAAYCLGPVEIHGLDFSVTHSLDGLIEVFDCADVLIRGCKLSQNVTNPAVSVARCQRVRVEHCRLTASSDVSITECVNASVVGCVNAGGGVIDIQDCNFVNVQTLTASSAPSRVLSIKRAFKATIEADASSGSATPLYFESVTNLETQGGGLTGTGNAGYGIETAGGGRYVWVGSSITGGTGDVLFDGTHACTWSLSFGSSYGQVMSLTSSAVGQAAPTKTILYGNVLFDGSGDHSSRELYYGIFNPAQNTGITATGTNVGTAYQLPAGEFYSISTVAAGTGVKLHNVSALPGPRCVVDNEGANTLKIYPSNGGTIDGAASYSLAAGGLKTFICVDFGADKWKST